MKDVYAVNFFMFIIWIWIVAFMLPFCNPVSFVIILIPVCVIIINILDSDGVTKETDETMFHSSSVNILLLVIGLFLSSRVVKGKMDPKFARWVILAIVFIVLSSIDIWVSGDRVRGMKYFRSLCEIFGVTIFVIIMLEYFVTEIEDSYESDESSDDQSYDGPLAVDDILLLE